MQRMAAYLALNGLPSILMKGSVFPLVPATTDAHYMTNSVHNNYDENKLNSSDSQHQLCSCECSRLHRIHLLR